MYTGSLGKSCILTKEEEAIAAAAQEEHRETSAKEGIIRDFLEKKIPRRLEQLRPDEETDVLERAAAWRAGYSWWTGRGCARWRSGRSVSEEIQDLSREGTARRSTA